MNSFEEQYYFGKCDCSSDVIICKRLSKFSSWWKKVSIFVILLFYLPLFIFVFPLGVIIFGIFVLSSDQLIVCEQCKRSDLEIQNILEKHPISK